MSRKERLLAALKAAEAANNPYLRESILKALEHLRKSQASDD